MEKVVTYTPLMSCVCRWYPKIVIEFVEEFGYIWLDWLSSDLNTVLFGIPESDFHTNYSIFVTVQKYILDSKRFER